MKNSPKYIAICIKSVIIGARISKRGFSRAISAEMLHSFFSVSQFSNGPTTQVSDLLTILCITKQKSEKSTIMMIYCFLSVQASPLSRHKTVFKKTSSLFVQMTA